MTHLKVLRFFLLTLTKDLGVIEKYLTKGYFPEPIVKGSTIYASLMGTDLLARHRVGVGFLFEKSAKKCRLLPSIVPDFRICKFKARCTL